MAIGLRPIAPPLNAIAVMAAHYSPVRSGGHRKAAKRPRSEAQPSEGGPPQRAAPRNPYGISPSTAAGIWSATRTIGIPVCTFWCISSIARGRSPNA